MSDHNLRNAINQCNKGYSSNEIGETIVNHSSVLTEEKCFQSSWNNKPVVNVNKYYKQKIISIGVTVSKTCLLAACCLLCKNN